LWLLARRPPSQAEDGALMNVPAHRRKKDPFKGHVLGVYKRPPAKPTLPDGVSVKTEPCWSLLYGNGTPADSLDVSPHYDTESEAAEAASEFTMADLGTPTAHRNGTPCVLIACTACGYQFDADEPGVVHFVTVEQALVAIRDCEWTTGPEGIRCPPSSDDCAPEAPRG
jgi:hypothetical protein